MATQRDWDQMLQCGLELKGKAQKVIDFAKIHGAGEGDEGEEDLEDEPNEDDVSNDSGESYNMNEADTKSDPAKDKKKALLVIALKKKMGKK